MSENQILLNLENNFKSSVNGINSTEKNPVYRACNLTLLHQTLIGYAEQDFNVGDYIDSLVTFIGDHKEYNSDFSEIVYMSTAQYLSLLFIDLMNKYFPEVEKFDGWYRDDSWGVIYHELYSPEDNPTPIQQSWRLTLDKFSKLIFKEYFFQIWTILSNQKDYVNPGECNGMNVFEDFQIVIRNSLLK